MFHSDQNNQSSFVKKKSGFVKSGLDFAWYEFDMRMETL